MLDENDETEATEPLEEPHEEEREEQPHYDDGLDDEQEYEKPEGPEAPYEDDDGDSDTEVLLTWSKDKRGNYIQHERRVKREPKVEKLKPPIEKVEREMSWGSWSWEPCATFIILLYFDMFD